LRGGLARRRRQRKIKGERRREEGRRRKEEGRRRKEEEEEGEGEEGMDTPLLLEYTPAAIPLLFKN
jgi:hypothetical protein